MQRLSIFEIYLVFSKILDDFYKFKGGFYDFDLFFWKFSVFSEILAKNYQKWPQFSEIWLSIFEKMSKKPATTKN